MQRMHYGVIASNDEYGLDGQEPDDTSSPNMMIVGSRDDGALLPNVEKHPSFERLDGRKTRSWRNLDRAERGLKVAQRKAVVGFETIQVGKIMRFHAS